MRLKLDNLLDNRILAGKLGALLLAIGNLAWSSAVLQGLYKTIATFRKSCEFEEVR